MMDHRHFRLSFRHEKHYPLRPTWMEWLTRLRIYLSCEAGQHAGLLTGFMVFACVIYYASRHHDQQRASARDAASWPCRPPRRPHRRPEPRRRASGTLPSPGAEMAVLPIAMDGFRQVLSENRGFLVVCILWSHAADETTVAGPWGGAGNRATDRAIELAIRRI